ncbi:hypothetical protein HDU87_006482 [Geranomyces variabilis]|uniref:Uncharacterized protein n=1 Tax=Geranomyces variabilis TaxID=109894 RepID=A0AAD5XQI1_9FUNG|nr:hypothetical protein HDU87_006482 [Geranomyces variabilis]
MGKMLPVIYETKSSILRSTVELPAQCTVGDLLRATAPDVSPDEMRAWLWLEPGNFWVPLRFNLDVDKAVAGLAELFECEPCAIMFRPQQDGSPLNTPVGVFSFGANSRAVSPEAEHANTIEPFTQEAVETLRKQDRMKLELTDGRVMVVDNDSLLGFIDSERRKGVSLAEIVVKAQDRAGKVVKAQLTRKVWHDKLLRTHDRCGEFIEAQFFAMASELAARSDLAALKENPVLCKGLRFLLLDAQKSAAGDAKSRKDRLDRAQAAPAFLSPIYFPRRADRDFLASFRIFAGITYLDLFATAFGPRVREGSACTGHELAPLIQATFACKTPATETQLEEYVVFNKYWQALTTEGREQWSSSDGDIGPNDGHNGKGKGKRVAWPF